MPRRFLLVLAAIALVGASCSSDGKDAAPTTAPASSPSTTGPTTTATGKDDTPYVRRGPHAVGQETLALADGRRVVVWYPADPSRVAGSPKENFDIASLLSPALQAKIPAAERPPFEIDSHPGATPDRAGGPYPIVLFSHGFGGFPEQSATLTTHLASWGFVVAAPDHVERSLSGLLGTASQGVTKLADVEVLRQTLAVVRADAARPASPLAGLLIADKVAVIGHSAGAGAAYDLAASDPEIASFISYSVGVDSSGTVPKVPGMLMLGTTDGVIPAAETRKLSGELRQPKYLVEIADAGHLVFSDICLIGRSGGGIVAIGKRLGLPIDMFEKLGTDGCKPGDTKPEAAFPAIDDLSVAFLRWTLGIDREPIGLDDPTIASQFTTADITVRAQP